MLRQIFLIIKIFMYIEMLRFVKQKKWETKNKETHACVRLELARNLFVN